jgi:putative endonuclease
MTTQPDGTLGPPARHDAPPPRSAGTRALGAWGEELAAAHLVACGWTVVGRNVRLPGGEIDLVALDGPELVLVEVKTRRSTAAGHPLEAVDPRKYARLRRLAGAYLAAGAPPHGGLRIDVVGVLLGPDGPRISHVTGAVR